MASSMPLQAAGKHSPGSAKNTLGQVKSSYASSIKALAHSQKDEEARTSKRGGLIIATMPTTPPARSLAGVTDEKNDVKKAVEDHLPVELLDEPTAKGVIKKCHCPLDMAHGAQRAAAHPRECACGLSLRMLDGKQVSKVGR